MRIVSPVLALLLSTATFAAEPGALAGSVRTSDGQPVPHLALTLRGPGGSQTILTGPDERYRATDLAGLAADEGETELFDPLTQVTEDAAGWLAL